MDASDRPPPGESPHEPNAPPSRNATLPAKPTVLLVGGGTGGHLFPNLAVAERLARLRPELRCELVISDRPVDLACLDGSGPLGRTAIVTPARPFRLHPGAWPAFLRGWRRSAASVRRRLGRGDVAAVVATGGFVSGPALAAGPGVPRAIVNLDARPGRANRLLARWVDRRFTTYPTDQLRDAEHIGHPIRQAAVAPGDPEDSRRRLGLDPHRPVLLALGGSAGARSINEMLLRLLRDPPFLEAAGQGDWQLLILAGETDAPRLRNAVAAELHAAATPAVVLPYPYHRDEHQRHNATPLAERGGLVIRTDHVDARRNVSTIGPTLTELMREAPARSAMVDALRATPRVDGAERIARWVVEQIAGAPRSA